VGTPRALCGESPACFFVVGAGLGPPSPCRPAAVICVVCIPDSFTGPNAAGRFFLPLRSCEAVGLRRETAAPSRTVCVRDEISPSFYARPHVLRLIACTCSRFVFLVSSFCFFTRHSPLATAFPPTHALRHGAPPISSTDMRSCAEITPVHSNPSSRGALLSHAPASIPR